LASTKTKRRTPQELLKRERVSADRLKIRLEKAQMKVALSYYAAADRGRRNKDWKSPVVSADQAIIPGVVVTAARARTTVANTWVGKAAVRSQKRNVVGRGIMVVPTAKDRKGKELAEVNRDAGEKFIRWASSRLACDLEKKRSFWQYQRCVVGEEFITGIGLLVWSYRPNPNNVGLRLQMLELEQLNMSIRSYQKNEVRSGVEIDEDGAAVAYHFYRKTPNDYLGTGLEPLRVPAFNVFPYFDAERVRQTVGISQLAPVLQDVRDFSRIKDSTLSRVLHGIVHRVCDQAERWNAGHKPVGDAAASGGYGCNG
jgi:capsid protein